MCEDDLAAADIQADAICLRACSLPDGSKLNTAVVKVASTGFGDTSFIGFGVDALALSYRRIAGEAFDLVLACYRSLRRLGGGAWDATWRRAESRLLSLC